MRESLAAMTSRRYDDEEDEEEEGEEDVNTSVVVNRNGGVRRVGQRGGGREGRIGPVEKNMS